MSSPTSPSTRLLSTAEMAIAKGCTEATIRKNLTPAHTESWRYSGRSGVTYYYDPQTYIDWQPRRSAPRPAATIDVLAAIFTVNRYAKRCRDAASACYMSRMHGLSRTWKEKKEDAYHAKGQALHYAIEEGLLRVEGIHRFPDGNHAEVLVDDGYRFHRPCPEPVSGVQCIELGEMESKPKERKEPRLKDALHSLDLFLADKPVATVFEWPARPRYSYASVVDDDEDDEQCDY